MNKNREARRAALERVRAIRQDVIVPKKAQPIFESNPEELLETVERGYLEATIGELLERARTARKVGKRELARRMDTNHARVSQMEGAANLELKSVLEAAGLLEYDVRIALVPREGGRGIGALLKTVEIKRKASRQSQDGVTRDAVKQRTPRARSVSAGD